MYVYSGYYLCTNCGHVLDSELEEMEGDTCFFGITGKMMQCPNCNIVMEIRHDKRFIFGDEYQEYWFTEVVK